MVITDGDPQELSQIDNAIVNIIFNAKRFSFGTTFPDLPSSVVDENKKIILPGCTHG